MRIGDFARASGVSIKTLRFYDDSGLFKPARRDPLTGYRRYDPEQLSELAAILALRELGLPLAEIKGALHRSSASARRTMLEQAQRELRRAIDEKSRSLSWVEAELRRLAGPPPSAAVVLKHRPALRVVSVRATLGASRDILELEREVRALVPAPRRGRWQGTLWHHCEDGQGAVEAEHFIEVVGPPPRDTSVQVLPAITAACAYSRDAEEASKAAFAEVRFWMAARSYELVSTKREIYWPGLLEIEFPIAVEPVSIQALSRIGI